MGREAEAFPLPWVLRSAQHPEPPWSLGKFASNKATVGRPLIKSCSGVGFLSTFTLFFIPFPIRRDPKKPCKQRSWGVWICPKLRS